MNPSGPDQGTPSNVRPSSMRRSTWLIVGLLTMVVVCLALVKPPFTELIELKLYDLKFQYRGPLPAGKNVAIVAIDDDSLKSVGRWPWPREVVSALMKRLKEAQPRVIGLDIIFAEKSDTAVADSLDQVMQKLGQQGLGSEKVFCLLKEEKKACEYDRRLAETISQGPPAVLGFYFKKVGPQVMSPEPPEALSPTVIQVSSYNMVRRLGQQEKQLPIIGAEGVEVNVPIISLAAAGGGYFNMIPDLDGAVRWYPLAIGYGPYVFAPLSLVTLQHYLDNKPLMITISPFGVKEVRLGRQLIPVDRYGRFYINYSGNSGSYPTYSAAAVLEGKLPPGALKDKIVLVGATAVGIYDMRTTPFSGVFPGVEIQATLMYNILRGNFLRSVSYSPIPELLIIIALGLLLGLVLPYASALWILGFSILLLQGYIISNYLIFRYLGVSLVLLYPLLEIVLVSAGVNVYSFLIEEKARASLKKAFQSYVAPSVVEEIIKHPEMLRLGGERRELTIFFCDIRGFTTLSESLEPEEVVNVLHGFLNPMSKIVVKHGGTIDKFMGDAIMALFGAPLHYPDHAGRACKTALEMQDTLKSLSQEWESKGLPHLKIGVGINSGVVSVGNMGSDTLFDYTAIGDNVNLASRLEGLNKTYNAEIIVSESTAKALDQSFILRELDCVRVKGKKQAVAIFELLSLAPADDDLTEFLHFYHQGLKLYKARQWDESIVEFKKALWIRPEDHQSLRYCSMAQKYGVDPPASDWECVAHMETK